MRKTMFVTLCFNYLSVMFLYSSASLCCIFSLESVVGEEAVVFFSFFGDGEDQIFDVLLLQKLDGRWGLGLFLV